jgi:hypothetical protein
MAESVVTSKSFEQYKIVPWLENLSRINNVRRDWFGR